MQSTEIKHNFLQVLEGEICTFIIPSESTSQDVSGKGNTLRKTKFGKSWGCTGGRGKAQRSSSRTGIAGELGWLQESPWELAGAGSAGTQLPRGHLGQRGTLGHCGAPWDSVGHRGTL